MTTRHTRRRYRKAEDRRVWVLSEANEDLTPQTMARVLASAALEQARREYEAQQQRQEPTEAVTNHPNGIEDEEPHP